MNAKIWGRWLARLFKKAPRLTRRRVRPQSRLSFESLEDRLVPTTYTWTGLGGSPNWGVAANWSSSAGGTGVPSNGSSLVFSTLSSHSAQAPTNDNIANLQVASITFSGAGYSLGGDPFILTGGITVNGGLATETINNGITLTPSTLTLQNTITVNAGSTLDLAGVLTGSEPAVGSTTAATETAKETLTKTGTGTLQLDGNNGGFYGAVVIANSGGIIRITNSQALGGGSSVTGAPTSGTTTVNTGGQLQLSQTGATPLTVPEQLIINGTGITNNGALLNVVGKNKWAGTITMNSNSEVGAYLGTSLEISGTIQDTGSGDSITINGASTASSGQGTIIFSHAGGNTYHGQTIINNGILEIEDPLSLGAGANSATPQSGTPQAETIVNYNSTTGVGGTLEINFNAAILGTGSNSPNGLDPNGILQTPNPSLATYSKADPYVGFQVFNDLLVLNGPGFNPTAPNSTGFASGVLGALYNLSGTNGWDGNVILGSPSTVPNTGDVDINAAANTSLTISGVVSSASPLPNPNPNLEKIGAGNLTLNNVNTFTGDVFIEQGSITVGNSEALGSATTNTVFTGYYPTDPLNINAGAIVDSSLAASLQLQVDSGVVGQQYDGVIGSTPALSRSHYRNLGYDSVNLSGPGQELDITGTTGTFQLTLPTYNSAGVLTTYNTHPSGSTTALTLNIASTTLASDLTTAITNLLNNAGYPATGNVSVSEDIGSTGNVYRILFSGALAQKDIPLMAETVLTSSSTVQVNPIYGLTIANPLFEVGDGVPTASGLGTGALDSISGLNTYTGPISLPAFTVASTSSIGVQADTRFGHNLEDSNYLADDYSLTITGNGTTSGIVGGGNLNTLDKWGYGDLILPTANQYVSANNIEQGWVTVQNNQSLGVQQNLIQTKQTYTTVDAGAAVMLDPQSGFLTLANNFALSGNGIAPGINVPPVFGLINADGAIENLNGSNLLTGIIQLNGNAGLGVEQVFAPAGGTDPTSQLTITGTLEDYTNPATGTIVSGGITKLGSRRLVIEGTGTYTGNDNIDQGVLLLQNSTGLGAGNAGSTQTVTVLSGAALEIGNTSTALEINNSLGSATYTSSNTGGIQEGLEVWGEHLILNGAGDPTFGDTALTVLSSNAPTTGPDVQTIAVSPLGSFNLIYNGLETGISTLTAISETGTTVTATVSSVAGLKVGETVTISGVSNPAYDGQVVITSITGNTFTYTAAAGLGSSGALTNATVLASISTVGTPAAVAAAIQNAIDGLLASYPGAYATVVPNGNVYLVTIVNPEDTGTATTDAPQLTVVSTTGQGNSAEAFVNTTEAGSTNEMLAPVNDSLVSTDNTWEGPVSLNTSTPTTTASTNVSITVPSNSRLIVNGNINDAGPPTGPAGTEGSSLTLLGGGELDLNGSNTYNGTTYITQGTLTAGSSTALGSTGISDTQTVTLSNATPNVTAFVLSFTSLSGSQAFTTSIPYTGIVGSETTPGTDEYDIDNALSKLATISGSDAGGTVSVVEHIVGSTATITVTFGGTLSGFEQNLMGAAITSPPPTTGTPPTITVTQAAGQVGEGGTIVANGSSLQLAGSIAIAGEPLLVEGTGSLPDVQTVTITPIAGGTEAGTFELIFTGADSTKSVVSDSTVPLTVTDANLATDMQTALNELGNIDGIGGTATVVQVAGTNTYQITFGGTLEGKELQPLTDNLDPTFTGATLTTATTQVGISEAQSIPTQWFSVGPDTVANGQTAGSSAVAGSVTAEAVDPEDPNTIYIATAGGGVWKTINGGQTWNPIFSAIPEIQQVFVNSVGTFTLSFNGETTSETLSSSDPNLASDMQTALNQLGTIGGVGGQVTVFQNGSLDDIQTITATATSGQFTLNFMGPDSTGTLVEDTTTDLNFASPTLASDIQNALNALSNIGGVGGSVSVVQSGKNFTITFGGTLSGVGVEPLSYNVVLPFSPGGSLTIAQTQQGSSTYQVTFSGEMAGYAEPVIVANPSTSGGVTTSELQAGADPSFAGYVGGIAIDPNFPNIIYIGTGVADNSPDSFYGTGIYESTNFGVTWTLLTNNTSTNPTVALNPFYGKVISAMQVDPQLELVDNNIPVTQPGNLIVSDGDYTQGQNEVQTLDFEGFIPTPFTLSLTAANASGELVTDTTPALNLFSPTLLTDITTALDNFSNIGGVGGYVTDAVSATGGIAITFHGNLSVTTLPALVTDWPLPSQVTPPAPAIGVIVSAVSGPTTDVNGTTGIPIPATAAAGNTPGTAPGIWEFVGSGVAGTSGSWYNLTSVVSTARGSIGSTNTADPIYGGGTFPSTPGPDDNYQVYFPQSNATWSDITFSYEPDPVDQEVLYAALGSSSIGTINTPAGTAANGVFWTTSWQDPSFGDLADVTWLEGNPYTTAPAYVPDLEAATMFPVVMYQGNNSGGSLEPIEGETSSIKISAVSGGTYSPITDFENPGLSTIYALVSGTGGALENIYESTDGGNDWTAIGIPGNSNGLPGQTSNEGQYDDSILATSANTIYIGGQVASGNIPGQTGQIFMSQNAGASWTDISVLAGSGPHDSQHDIVQDGTNGVLFGSDGGLWLLNPANTSWSDLNGNLSNLEVNSVATIPTSITGIATPGDYTTIAGLQSNGTAGFSNGQTWSELDASAGGEMSTSQVFIGVNPLTLQPLYYEVQTQIGSGSGAIVRESNDEGVTWQTILSNASNPFIQTSNLALQMDTINPERLVAGGSISQFGPALWQTQDGSDAAPIWTNIGAGLPAGFSVAAIGLAQYQGVFQTDTSFVDSTDQGANTYVPGTIYVTDGTSVYLTKDDGQTWVNRTPTTASGGSIGGSIVQLVVDPTNMDTVYAVRNVFGTGQIWESNNAGQTWREIATSNGLPDVPVWTLAIDPRNGNLYAGTDIGVFELAGGTTGTNTWQPFGTGMPTVQVHQLVLNQNSNTLLAATYGDGVYQLTLDYQETVSSTSTSSTTSTTTSALTGLSGPAVWEGPVILAGTGPVAIGALGAPNLPTGISINSVDIVGTISDLVAGSDPTIEKVGNGDVVFAGSNIYGGETEVLDGNLVVDNEQALGLNSQGTSPDPTDGTLVMSGASLELESNLDDETVTLIGDGTTFDDHNTGSLRSISGDNTFIGSIILVPDPTTDTTTIGADSGSVLDLTGVVTGGNSSDTLVKEGAGTLILAGSNTYTGTTAVYQGVLQTQASSAFGSPVTNSVEVLDGSQLQLQSQQTLNVTATGGEFTLSFNGGTTAVLNAASNTLASDIQSALNTLLSNLGLTGAFALVEPLANGIFTVTFGGPLIGDDAQNLLVNTVALAPLTGGTVAVGSTPLNVPNTLTLSGAGVYSGAPGAILNSGGNNTWSGNIALAIAPGFSPTTLPTGDVAVGAAAGTTLTLEGTISGLLVGGSSDAGHRNMQQEEGLDKVGSGMVILQNPHSSPNTFNGGVTVSQGVLVVGDSGALGNHAMPIPSNGTAPTNDPTLATQQQVVVLSSEKAGEFQLSFDGNATSLPFSTTAANMESKLNGPTGLFASLGSVSITETPAQMTTQTVPTTSSTETGNVFTFTFAGGLADTTLPLSASGSGGTVAGASFLAMGGEDVVVESGAELDINSSQADTKLTAPITTTDATDTISVASTANIAVNTVIQVDNEQMLVTQINGDNLTVTRGYNNTFITTHAVTAPVVIPINVVGHTFTLNGAGQNGDGALQNTSGDNTLSQAASGTINPVVEVLPQTQPGQNPSFSASSGTSLSIAGALEIFSPITYLTVGGGGGAVGSIQTGTGGGDGGGTVILPAGTTFGTGANPEETIIIGGSLQVDGTLGNVSLDGGVISGTGHVGTITDLLSSTIPEGINPGDNGDSVLTSTGTLIFPNENSTPNINITGTLTSTGPATGVPAITLGSSDTFYAYFGNPGSSNSSSLLQVDGGPIDLNGATLAGYVNPNVLDGDYTTVIKTDYNSTTNKTDVVTGYFGEQSAAGSTPLDTNMTLKNALNMAGLQINYTTTAYIGDEKFLVDYVGPSSTVNDEVIIDRVPEVVTMSGLTSSVAAPVYGQDEQVTVTLTPETNTVNLTGSTVLFQIQDTYGTYHQYTVAVEPVSPPTTNTDGVTEYSATLDMPESLGFPLLVTTNSPPPPVYYTVSALYEGTLSDGAQLYNPIEDGTVVNPPPGTTQNDIPGTSTPYGPDVISVAPANTTTKITAQLSNVNVASGSTEPYGSPLVFTATVTSTVPPAQQPSSAGLSQPILPPEGSVTFYDTQNGQTTAIATVQLVPGSNLSSTATFTQPYPAGSSTFLSGGDHSITAVYNADGVPDNYNASNSNASAFVLHVSAAGTTMTIAANTTTINYSNTSPTLVLTATVNPAAGEGLPTGLVYFTAVSATTGGVVQLGSAQLYQVGNSTTATATLTTLPFAITGDDGNTNDLTQITASYAGDVNFGASSASTSIANNNDVLVTQLGTSGNLTSSQSTSTAGQPVTFTDTISPAITGGAAPTGTVNFFVNGTFAGTGTVSTLFGISSASYTPTSSQLPAGTDAITATYLGDDNYSGNTATLTGGQTVGKANTSTTLSIATNPTTATNPVQTVANAAVTLTAVVTDTSVNGGTPFGTVIFNDTTTGKTLGTATLNSGGIATLLAPLGTPVGTHLITATFQANGSFNASSASNVVDVKVVANGTRASSVTLVSSTNPSYVGESVTLTATIKDAGSGASQSPSGTVTFMDTTTSTPIGYAVITTSGNIGTAYLTTTTIPQGTNSITAIYSGNTSFAVKTSAAIKQVVNGVMTSAVTFTAPATATSVYGQPVTFTVNVTDTNSGTVTNPTGTVTFLFTNQSTGATFQGTGTLATSGTTGTETASFVTSSLSSALPVGTYSVQATYGGDSNFIPGSFATTTQTVTQATSTTTVTGTSITTLTAISETGKTVTATVSSVAGLTVGESVTISGVSNTGYDGSVEIATINKNTNTFTYSTVSGLGSSGTLTNAVVTSSTVFGQALTFTATVTPSPIGGSPTGTVTFTFTGTNSTVTATATVAENSSGAYVATYKTSSLPSDTYSVTATYSGDSNVQGSTSATVSELAVAPDLPNISIAASTTNSNSTVTFTATLTASAPATGIPTGSISFYIDGVFVGTSPINSSGKASITLPSGLKNGNHTVEAVYSGDANFEAETQTKTFDFVVGRGSGAR